MHFDSLKSWSHWRMILPWPIRRTTVLGGRAACRSLHDVRLHTFSGSSMRPPRRLPEMAEARKRGSTATPPSPRITGTRMSDSATIRLAIYPGSFDPITRGHEDIVRRALDVRGSHDRGGRASAHPAERAAFFDRCERVADDPAKCLRMSRASRPPNSTACWSTMRASAARG